MLFSIIIPTYNNRHELQGCLSALANLRGGAFEVLVGVDGSTDGTSEWLASTTFSFPLQVLHHPKRQNRGRAATRNLALPLLQGKYALFLDSDMQADPDLLSNHARVLDQGGAISIGSVHYANAHRNLWVRYTATRGVAKFPDGAQVPFHYFITPNTAVPTADLIAVGGFDAAINRYGGEDMELGYRLHLHTNPRFFYNASAAVHTTQPKTLDQALPQLHEYGATGLRYITQKWPALRSIYWVEKCHSPRLKDRIFEALTARPFQTIAKALLPMLPFSIQQHLISYLVIAAVHSGYRVGK